MASCLCIRKEQPVGEFITVRRPPFGKMNKSVLQLFTCFLASKCRVARIRQCRDGFNDDDVIGYVFRCGNKQGCSQRGTGFKPASGRNQAFAIDSGPAGLRCRWKYNLGDDRRAEPVQEVPGTYHRDSQWTEPKQAFQFFLHISNDPIGRAKQIGIHLPRRRHQLV